MGVFLCWANKFREEDSNLRSQVPNLMLCRLSYPGVSGSFPAWWCSLGCSFHMDWFIFLIPSSDLFGLPFLISRWSVVSIVLHMFSSSLISARSHIYGGPVLLLVINIYTIDPRYKLSTNTDKPSVDKYNMALNRAIFDIIINQYCITK